MSLTSALMEHLRSQFGRPRGVWGPLVGWILATRSSNRIRSVWAVSLLDIQRRDRVLEIGFGPGIAIREISRLAPDGYVCGLDHSARMLSQAARRNARAIREGLVDLRPCPVERLPSFDIPFDKILAVNTVGFWKTPDESLLELRHLLRGGGRIAVVHQPRDPGATDATSTARGAAMATRLLRAGFSDVRIETLALQPAAVCVIGTAPSGTRAPRDRPDLSPKMTTVS